MNVEPKGTRNALATREELLKQAVKVCAMKRCTGVQIKIAKTHKFYKRAKLHAAILSLADLLDISLKDAYKMLDHITTTFIMGINFVETNREKKC